MRPIHLVRIDKVRPALILTRDRVRGLLASVTVAPITSTIRGIPTEVAVGIANGLDHDGAVSCDNIMTVSRDDVGRLVGYLRTEQEPALAAAIIAAYDLVAERG
jgi:mRNA interferase MazF